MLLCNDDVNEDGKCSLPETDLSERQCYSVSLLFHYKLKLHQFNSDSNLFLWYRNTRVCNPVNPFSLSLFILTVSMP